jgi:hypothetical protein
VARSRRTFLTKDTTREYREFRKELAATGRENARCAKVARQKENFVGRNRNKDNVVLRTSKGWTLGRRQRAQQQHNRGIMIETYRKTNGLKRIAGSPVPLQKSKV